MSRAGTRAAAALLLSVSSFAQDGRDPAVGGLPQGDPDLRDVVALCAEARAKAAAVEELTDPRFDEGKALAAARAMSDLRGLLSVLEPWTREALRAAADARVARLKSAIAQEGRLAAVQETFAWQCFARDLAGAAWHAAAFAGSIRKLGALGRTDKSNDGLLEALWRNPRWSGPGLEAGNVWTDANGHADSLGTLAARLDALPAGDRNAKWREVGADLLDAQERMVAIADLLQRAHEARDLGAKVLARADLAAIAEPLCQVLCGLASAAQAEIEGREAELRQALAAEERALAAAHGDRIRLGLRHDAHVKAAEDQEAAWLALLRAFGLPPTAGADPPPGEPATWGEAFRLYVPELRRRVDAAAAAVSALEVAPGEEPRLSIDGDAFAPGAAILVRYDVPPAAARRGWIGVQRASDPHGSEARNARAKLELRPVPAPADGTPSRGEMRFPAPKEPGLYEIRLNDAGRGRELLAAGFRVRAAGEGVRLAFGSTGPAASSATLTLPPAAPGEHVEHALDLRAVDARGRGAAGRVVSVRVLDAAGRETRGGPRITGRWGLMSDGSGAVTNGGRKPIVFGIPQGSWTIELSSPEAENVLSVKCGTKPKDEASPTCAVGVEPPEINTGRADEGQRTLMVFGWVDRAREGHRLEAQVGDWGGVVGRGVGEPVGGRWVPVGVDRSMCFLFPVVVREGADHFTPAIRLRIRDVGKGRDAWQAETSFRSYHIAEGYGGVRVIECDPLGNEIWKPWTLHHDDGKGGRARLESQSDFARYNLIPAGGFEISYGCYYAPDGGYEKWLRGLKVLGGERVAIRIRDTTGIINARVFDVNGKEDDAAGRVSLCVEVAGEKGPEIRTLRAFARWNMKQTPCGFEKGYSQYAEAPPGTYVVRFETDPFNAGTNRVEHRKVALRPGGWEELAFEDK